MWKVMKACVSRCWGITWHCLPFPFFQFFIFPLLHPQNFFTCSFSFLIQFDLRYLHFQNRFSRAMADATTTAFSSVSFILLMLMPLNFKAASTFFFFFSFRWDFIAIALLQQKKIEEIGRNEFFFHFFFGTRRRKISILKKINFLFPSSHSCYCSLCFQKKKERRKEKWMNIENGRPNVDNARKRRERIFFPFSFSFNNIHKSYLCRVGYE